MYLSYLLQTLNIFLVTVRFFIELVAVPTLYNCFIVEIQVNAAQSKNNKSEIYLGKSLGVSGGKKLIFISTGFEMLK